MFVCTMMSAAVKKTALRVLYVGGSPEFDTDSRIKDADKIAKSAKERTASFDQFLREYFTVVKSIDAKDYTPEMSKNYDVTIIDGTPKPVEVIKKMVHYEKWGDREEETKIYFPKDFDRPVLTIAEAGETVGRGSGIKSDWYCLCLDADAHSWVKDHPIFRGPFKVSLKEEVKPTPDPAKNEYAYFIDYPIPDEIPMWRVQNTDHKTTPGYRIGMVARPWGFADSPECEVISSGVCAKTIDAVALGRHANFFHWGFSASPKYMTEQAKPVFANALVYIAKFAGKKPIARKWDENIATKSYVKERRYLASKEGWKGFEAITKKRNEQMKLYSDSLKQLQAQGKELNEMEKMYVQFAPQPEQTYEQFLQRYNNDLFPQFGTDEQKYMNYFDENRDYFHGGAGYSLTVDEDAKSLGIPVGDLRLLDKAISLWESNQDAAKGKRLLTRYTLCRFGTPDAWRSWYNTYKERMFFTESGGWFYMVNSEDPRTPGNDYSVIGK